MSQAAGSQNSSLSIPIEDPGPDSLQFAVTEKKWQPLASIPDGRALSCDPYAALNGDIRILRGATWLPYEIRFQVWGTLGNCSCGFLTLLTTLRRAWAFPIFKEALGNLSALLQERFNTILRLSQDVECDLECTGIRSLLCKYAIECLVSPSDSIQIHLGKMLNHEWRKQPDHEQYAIGTCMARELGINDTIGDENDPDSFPKMNALAILAHNSYYNDIIQQILQGYLGFTMAIVIFQKLRICGSLKWIHYALNDSIHPTNSIMWCPMLQRDNGHSAASNHYLAVTNADGSCPIRTFPISN